MHLLELDEIKKFLKTVSYTFTKRRPRPTQGCTADDDDDIFSYKKLLRLEAAS